MKKKTIINILMVFNVIIFIQAMLGIFFVASYFIIGEQNNIIFALLGNKALKIVLLVSFVAKIIDNLIKIKIDPKYKELLFSQERMLRIGRIYFEIFIILFLFDGLQACIMLFLYVILEIILIFIGIFIFKKQKSTPSG